MHLKICLEKFTIVEKHKPTLALVSKLLLEGISSNEPAVYPSAPTTGKVIDTNRETVAKMCHESLTTLSVYSQKLNSVNISKDSEN